MKRSCICLLFLILFWPAFSISETHSHTYATWENMELDKCASAWLIKRFVDKEAFFRFYPKGQLISEGVPFDVPEAEIRRYHNMAAFEYIIKKYKINDPALQRIGKIIHDIEINYWGRKRFKESKKLNDTIQGIVDTSKTVEETLGGSFIVFDRLYLEFHSHTESGSAKREAVIK